MVTPDSEGAPLTIQNGTIRTSIDLRAYRMTAIQKAAYRFAKEFTLVLGANDQNSLPVTFLFAEGTAEGEAFEAVRVFFRELLDQELRERIGEETRAIRSLILAQAFSKTDLIRRE